MDEQMVNMIVCTDEAGDEFSLPEDQYWQQMQGQLVQAMLLTGCASLADVREHIIYRG